MHRHRTVLSGTHGAQRELAAAVGIEGPTLTHHLNRMEASGLVTRRRDPANRRVHRVELTEAGEATFARLVEARRGLRRAVAQGLHGAPAHRPA
jgi:MarR family transcriptional regulator, transcriptional regulator for hemolysin